MIPNNYKTSLRIPSQLPEFVRDDVNYETFVSFVEAYYEWMELANTANANNTIASTSGEGVTYASKNLYDYFDVDTTLDGFLKYYINDFLPYFPEDALADKTKVLKIAKQLYQAKGTPASFRLLFRLLYNSSAELLMTGDLVFRASAGDWYVPKYLKIKGDSSLWLTQGLETYRVFGTRSKSFATIEKVILSGDKLDVYISNIQRLFESGEDVIVVDTNNQNIYVKDGEISNVSVVGSETITGKVVGAISTITINPKYRGLTYNVGDPVVVYGGLSSDTALSATAEVSEVTKGSIQRINTLDGGFGYIPGEATINFATVSNTTIQFLNNGGASARVGTFDTTAGSNSNINSIITDRISVKQNIVLSNANYFFANDDVTASVNTNTRLVDAFSFYQSIGYPIDTVIVENGGGGFSQLPIAIARTHFYDVDTGGIHNLDDIGQLAPIQIIEGGLGYKANDRITIIGGQGQGASANVKTVDGSGSITSVEYVPFEDFSKIYPIGGTGYKIADVLGTEIHEALSANPSSNIQVSSITQGKFPLWDTVYQTFDTYANSFFTATVNGIDTTNKALKVYNIEGTLNSTQPLVSLANTQNTVTATSNSISGIAAELFVPGILGAGAQLELTTDRIGSVTKIKIINGGEDYVSNPSISLRVQDLCISSVTGIDYIKSGTLLFQGQDANTSSYKAFVDRLISIDETGNIANNTYNLRVYNYTNKPLLYNSNDSANTILQVFDGINSNPTMRLISARDVELGYSNGVKTYGDGNARASSKFLNGLIFGQGTYLDTKGQPSSYSVLQSKDYNDYTYVLSVEQPISKYRNILKNLLHPAGMKVIGRDILKNQKSFGVKHDSGTSLIKPLQYWANWPVGNPYAYVTMNVSGIIANSMIKVVSGGTGYSPSTTVSINAIDGRGTGATAVANIANGVIVSIDVTAPGQDYILNPVITISDPTTRGGNSNASVTASIDLSSNVMVIQNMNGGSIDSITQITTQITTLTANSSSYGSNGWITFTGGTLWEFGNPANAYMNVKSTGEVKNVVVFSGGSYLIVPTLAIPPSGNSTITITTKNNVGEHWITVYPEQTGGNCKVFSTTKTFYNANSTIILEDDTFLTFPNVIYGYANTSNLAISISDISVTNTPSYNIVNNGVYSNTQNHLEDIIFAGDNLTVAGNTYVVQSVDYNAHLIYVINARAVLDTEDQNQILTEDGVPGNSNNIIVGAYTLSFGTRENPVPMTINRSISTGNVFIKALI